MEGIQFKNVSKSYKEGPQDLQVLNQVSFSVEPGEFVAIIGPSGSGKSTLLSIAGALLQPSEGEVLVNNMDISSLDAKGLSQLRLEHIGFILQSANLVPYLTVLDQLLIVKKMGGAIHESDKIFATELLEEIGLGTKLNKYPDALSGGEKQRVAIARAFMNDPNIILADEPTANLDTNRAHTIVKLIASGVKSRNKAAVMVTHDERMLEYCDRVYRMNDGHLEEVQSASAVEKL